MQAESKGPQIKVKCIFITDLLLKKVMCECRVWWFGEVNKTNTIILAINFL